MWNGNQIRQFLLAEQDAFLNAWAQQAHTRLWHLSRAQLAPGGKIYAVGVNTVQSLADYFAQFGDDTPPDPDLISETMLAPLVQNTTLWAELPYSWSDTSTLLFVMGNQWCVLLREKGAEEVTRYRVYHATMRICRYIAFHHIQRLEQQIFHEQEEAATNRHLARRFLANASHELRTPLTAVLGFSELLQEGTYGPLTPEQHETVRHIENSAENLLEIVNNLLDVLNIQADKLTLTCRPIQIGPVLSNLFEILTPLAQRKKIQFVLDLPDDLGAIEADENILRHIVYHLLASSLRATPTGGSVHLTSARFQNTLEIITRDTALHLPPDVIANMMHPFSRLENQPSRGYDSWETGLPLVRRYVELHGGTLALESLPEQGTTFRITLPLTCPPA